MYAIRKDGTLVDYVEYVNYIKVHEEGFYILCTEDEAQGVAVDGEIYSVKEENNVPEKPLVTITEVDIKEVAKTQEQELIAAKEEVSNTQLALCEVYELITSITEV